MGGPLTYTDARGQHITDRMLELSRPQPGERVLELACGTGGPGLDAAPLVAPGGDVVISDFAAEMTAIAAERIAERGLPNASARVLDLEHIDEADASYDVVLCREGLMLVPDPELAASEIRRILRPGGRVAISVWGPRERNPWLGVVFDAVTEQLGVPTPPPGIPHPFSLADANELRDVLAAAGLARRPGRRALDAVPRGIGRRVVGAHRRPRRAAGEEARRAPGGRRTGAEAPRRRGGRRLPDARRARDPGRVSGGERGQSGRSGTVKPGSRPSSTARLTAFEPNRRRTSSSAASSASLRPGSKGSSS